MSGFMASRMCCGTSNNNSLITNETDEMKTMKTMTMIIQAACLAGACSAQAATWAYGETVWGDAVTRNVDNGGIGGPTGCPNEESSPQPFSTTCTTAQSQTATKKRQFSISLGFTHTDAPSTYPFALGWQSNWETARSFNITDTSTGATTGWHQVVVGARICSERTGSTTHTKYDGDGYPIDCHVDYAYKHAGSPVVRPDYAYYSTPLRICTVHNIPNPLPPYIGDATCPSVP